MWEKHDLSIIAGLEQATEGSIYFDEENVGGLEAEERDIGMVFQDYALYPHMTVQENIAFPLKMQGWKKKDRIEKVKEAAKMLQIEEYLKRKAGEVIGWTAAESHDCACHRKESEDLTFR